MSGLPISILPTLQLVLCPVGCAPAPTDSGELISDGGTYHLDLTLDPAEPVAGEEVLASLLVMTRADMASLTDATVEIEPWMPMHGHGISDPVAVEELGDGLYEGRFVFSMPGSWELRIQIEAEPGTDGATAPVEVQ